VHKPPVIVGLTGYSRVMVAKMIPSREAHDILSGNLACLVALGAGPKKGVYDCRRRSNTEHVTPVEICAVVRQ
jgi:hypothetical protein